METIGDAYMVVSGAPEKDQNHAEKVCDMALDMVEAITDLKDPSTGQLICFVLFSLLMFVDRKPFTYSRRCSFWSRRGWYRWSQNATLLPFW